MTVATSVQFRFVASEANSSFYLKFERGFGVAQSWNLCSIPKLRWYMGDSPAFPHASSAYTRKTYWQTYPWIPGEQRFGHFLAPGLVQWQGFSEQTW